MLPKTISTLKGEYDAVENELQDVIAFEDYDTNGNLIEVKKVNGSSISYIWGYNKEFPIAKIENATYSEIYSALGITKQDLLSLDESDLTTIDSLRSSLSNAMVTTMTYEPLIGISSITDPRGYTIYYNYDEFNRLKEIRDADNKLVTDYKYHYKNQ